MQASSRTRDAAHGGRLLHPLSVSLFYSFSGRVLFIWHVSDLINGCVEGMSGPAACMLFRVLHWWPGCVLGPRWEASACKDVLLSCVESLSSFPSLLRWLFPDG